MNETSNSLELLEPVSPETLVPDSWVEPWMIAAAVALLVALLAVAFFVKRKPAPPDPAAAREAAYKDAALQLSNVTTDAPRDAAVQCSLIVRNYAARAAGDPALFETHEETVARHEALANFSEEARTAAAAGFARLAALKYAAVPPEAVAADVVADSGALLETLHRGFQA